MKVKPDFEDKLKELDKDLSVRKIDGREVAGIYWKEYSLDVSIPAEDIYEDVNPQYGVYIGDKFVLHRTSDMALRMTKATLQKMAEDKEFYELVTERE